MTYQRRLYDTRNAIRQQKYYVDGDLTQINLNEHKYTSSIL